MTKKNKIGQKKSKNISKTVLQVFVSNSSKSFNYKQVASKLNLNDSKSRNEVIQAIAELKAMSKIEEVERGKYRVVPESDYYTGRIEITANGNGYVICDELEHDIYIPSRNVNKALNNDLVKVYVYSRKKNRKQEGDVIEILKRSKTEFVGVTELHENFAFVIPDDAKMYCDIFIAKENVVDVEDGDKVLASIIDWPEKSKNPFGKIMQVLGKPGDHDTEMHSILLEYGLPYKFPDEVEKFAENIPIEISEEEVKKRKDFREILTFTIDPKDAKDFDDALSFEVLENGNFKIGIHIADVSHYVKEKTLLDDEAYNRGTSVYLVDRVVPMLPEILSNNVCSLRPNEEKLTFSAVFEMDTKAHLVNQWFGRTVILSDHRFTYEEAQEIIEDSSELNNKDLTNAVLELDKLAKILRKQRMNKGAISFDKTEVKFDLDENFEPIGVYIKESKDANKLIEEFMLLANKKVAEFIGQKGGNPTKKTFVYRVHDEPNIDKLFALNGIIHKFGYSIDMRNKKGITQSLNKLLSDVHGKSESNMIETLTIRSMSKAEYTTENIGHYGLAFDYYTHFTSPIRRYPDVMVHRLLQHYLDGGKSPDQEMYEVHCQHSSEREVMATRAERDSIKYMQVKYMQDHDNQEFEGVISGVTEWGLYIEIIENKCEGLVRIKDIQSDFYIFDEKQYALVGQSTKEMYQLGDLVKVKVKNTDLEKKQLDFYLIE
ncbi:ribonuclease R [Namhaeicola litoreus]|uniref:Ribonuclease R n=1 Tax=Namhaeicola litoreus TaxID=1052145 RepID=A0ABW3Y1H7_9FLAO